MKLTTNQLRNKRKKGNYGLEKRRGRGLFPISQQFKVRKEVKGQVVIIGYYHGITGYG